MGSIDDSQGLKWAGRSPPNGGRSPAGNKQGGHSRECEGKSLRLSGQDELCFGWSQPQKELEGKLSWEREQLWQRELGLFENQFKGQGDCGIRAAGGSQGKG